MAKATNLPEKEQVTDYIENLHPALQKHVQAIRQIILDTDHEIGERIKWNNPSFYYTGEMKDFDPKEYKRDIVVFNLHKGRIMLVFPSGAKVNDDTGFLEGNYADGRRTAVIKDIDDLASKQEALKGVIKTWLKLIEK